MNEEPDKELHQFRISNNNVIYREKPLIYTIKFYEYIELYNPETFMVFISRFIVAYGEEES